MTVPKLHYISQGATTKQHIENIQNACVSGAELVQLRLKGLSNKQLLKAAKEAREITGHYQTRLIINDHYKIAKEVKADGVHLGKSDASPIIVRKHLGEFYFIGGTANTIQDCRTLIEQKVNYIGLGPFRYTTSKENLSPILGSNGYLTIVEELKTATPIIAVGGIVLENVPEILSTGIYGIAASGEITNNFNKISKFNVLLKGPHHIEQVWKIS